MFAVIFEVHPYTETVDTYLALAQELRPLLDDIEGFLSIERFTSIQRPGWVLSLSFWRDEAALVRWRTVERHHEVQEQGRASVFADYRLRVSQVILDHHEGQFAQPDRRTAYNDITFHPSMFATIFEVELSQHSNDLAARAEAPIGYHGLVHSERFESIYAQGKQLVLSTWQNEQAAMEWHAHITQSFPAMQGGYRWRVTEVERDYGMFVRSEAPQYYPPVKPRATCSAMDRAGG